jgi:hypothetical protein
MPRNRAKPMGLIFRVTATLLSLPLLATGQDYLFFAPGVTNFSPFGFGTTSGTAHIGVGVEGFTVDSAWVRRLGPSVSKARE